MEPLWTFICEGQTGDGSLHHVLLLSFPEASDRPLWEVKYRTRQSLGWSKQGSSYVVMRQSGNYLYLWFNWMYCILYVRYTRCGYSSMVVLPCPGNLPEPKGWFTYAYMSLCISSLNDLLAFKHVNSLSWTASWSQWCQGLGKLLWLQFMIYQDIQDQHIQDIPSTGLLMAAWKHCMKKLQSGRSKYGSISFGSFAGLASLDWILMTVGIVDLLSKTLKSGF